MKHLCVVPPKERGMFSISSSVSTGSNAVAVVGVGAAILAQEMEASGRGWQRNMIEITWDSDELLFLPWSASLVFSAKEK